jgi:nicotinate-nucleotide adenylyltransferase
LIGSDQLVSFTKWQHYQKLLTEMPFYVYPRAGYPMEPLFPHMTPLSSPTLVVTNLSSTLIRHRLEQRLSTSHFLPTSIDTYIHNHKLYL